MKQTKNLETMTTIKSNLVNPKAKGQHQRRVKRAIQEMLFPGYTATIKVSDNVTAWDTCGQVQVYVNDRLIRCI